MLGIGPWIVEHEIKTYPNGNLVQQNLRDINLNKFPTIKDEIEKLLRESFIYPVLLNEWVSNPIQVNKKQGTIRVCTNFHNLNKACPKDNYLTLFIDKIIDDCDGNDIFSFMDGFSNYNQIQIKQADQHKTTFIFPWGTFCYKNIPFGLKNDGATFQQAMYYEFHDNKNIVQDYLYDLSSHSKKRAKHPTHLRVIFDRC